MKEIYLTRGLVALVDDEDFELVSHITWHASTSRAKTKSKTYAANKSGKNKATYMHRLIVGAPDGFEVDHVNGNGLDNRRANLRLAKRGQNAANAGKPRTNTSGYKGVTWNKERRAWVAQIGVDKKTIIIGRFADPVEAAMAYDAAALKHFGQFAYTNFPADA